MEVKLISLNTWGGKLFDPLIQFISTQSHDTDIFCFQEVFTTKTDKRTHKDTRANLLQDLKDTLRDYKMIFNIRIDGIDMDEEKVDFDLCWGNAIFYKSSFQVVNTFNVDVLTGDKPKKIEEANMAQSIRVVSIELQLNGKNILVSTMHGLTYPGDKLDTPNRLEQSKKTLDFLNQHNGEKILCGDFNLLPDTQSIKMIEKILTNLISKFNIQDTRGSLSPYFNQPDRQRFADFTFISSGVKVSNFQVPDAKVSDHLPMILTFDI